MRTWTAALIVFVEHMVRTTSDKQITTGGLIKDCSRTIMVRYFRYFIYLPHNYNNYLKMPKEKKKCRKRWRGGLKETIELMLIRLPQLQFFEDGIKITATGTI